MISVFQSRHELWVLLPHSGRSSAVNCIHQQFASASQWLGKIRGCSPQDFASQTKLNSCQWRHVRQAIVLRVQGNFEMSLQVSQLLGPEDGLNVVALQDGETHGLHSAFLLAVGFEKPNSAIAHPPCSWMCRLHQAAYRKMNRQSQAQPLRELPARPPHPARSMPWMCLPELCGSLLQHLPPGLWIPLLRVRAPLTAQDRPQDAIAA